MKGILFTLAAASLLWANNLQASNTFFPLNNFPALAGVNKVHSMISVTVLPATATYNEREIQKHFEIGIMREGVEISTNAPYSLGCKVLLFESQAHNGWYYAYTVELYEKPMFAGLYRLLFESGNVVTTPDRAPWKEIGEKCAESFSYAWLRANTGSNTAN